jgi:hypothetical protein
MGVPDGTIAINDVPSLPLLSSRKPACITDGSAGHDRDGVKESDMEQWVSAVKVTVGTGNVALFETSPVNVVVFEAVSLLRVVVVLSVAGSLVVVMVPERCEAAAVCDLDAVKSKPAGGCAVVGRTAGGVTVLGGKVEGCGVAAGSVVEGTAVGGTAVDGTTREVGGASVLGEEVAHGSRENLPTLLTLQKLHGRNGTSTHGTLGIPEKQLPPPAISNATAGITTAESLVQSARKNVPQEVTFVRFRRST